MPNTKHNVWTEQDLVALLECNFGVGIAPKAPRSFALEAVDPMDGLTIERTVYVYGVAGRQRSTAASTLIKMLRAADWRSGDEKPVAQRQPQSSERRLLS